MPPSQVYYASVQTIEINLSAPDLWYAIKGSSETNSQMVLDDEGLTQSMNSDDENVIKAVINNINLPPRSVKTLQVLKETPTVLRVCERVFVQNVGHFERDNFSRNQTRDCRTSSYCTRNFTLTYATSITVARAHGERG